MNLIHLFCCNVMCFGTEGSSCSFLTFWEARKSLCLFILQWLLRAPCCERRVRHCGEQDSPASTRGTALRLLCADAVDFHRQHDINTEGQNVSAGRWVYPTQRPYLHNEEPEHQRKELTCLRFPSLSGHGETYNPFLPIKCSSIMGCFHSTHIINSPFTLQN